jgi:hypothetical protein
VCLVCDGAEACSGGDCVDGVGDGVEVLGVEFGDGVESVFEAGGWGVEWSAGCVVEDEVVEADVEGFGDAGEGVE